MIVVENYDNIYFVFGECEVLGAFFGGHSYYQHSEMV